MARDPRNPKRRWFQFSLRTLLLFVTVFAVWFGTLAKRANDQRRAVAQIRAAGASVIYAHQIDHVPNRGIWPWPDWLRNLLGNDYFVTATGAFYYGQSDPTSGPPDLSALHGLSHVRYLEIYGHYTVDTLREIAAFQELEQLYITGSSGSGFGELRSLPTLRDLSVPAASLVNAQEIGLLSLPNLETLSIELDSSPGVEQELSVLEARFRKVFPKLKRLRFWLAVRTGKDTTVSLDERNVNAVSP